MGAPSALAALVLAALSSMPAAAAPPSLYPLCRLRLPAPDPSRPASVEDVDPGFVQLLKNTPLVARREEVQAGKKFIVGDLSPCGADLAQKLEEGLAQRKAQGKFPQEYAVERVEKAPAGAPAQPTRDGAPVAERSAVTLDYAQRLAAGFRAAYGDVPASRTGLHGEVGIGADSARAAGFDPDQVRRDPQVAAAAGVKHFENLLSRYNGDARKAALAYCAGPGTVERRTGVPPQCRKFAAAFEGGAEPARREMRDAVRDVPSPYTRAERMPPPPPQAMPVRRRDMGDELLDTANSFGRGLGNIIGGIVTLPGRLIGAFVEDVDGLIQGDRNPGRRYATREMALGLYRTALDLQAKGLPPLRFGDISKEHGGKISGHVSHRDGKNADLRLYGDPRMDAEIVKSVLKSMQVKQFYLNKIRIEPICEALRSEPGYYNQLCRFHGAGALLRQWKGHTAHIHVRIE